MEEAIMKTLEGQPIGPAAEPVPPPAAGQNGPGEGALNSAHYHGTRFLPPQAQTAGPPYHYCFAAGEPATNKTPKGELSGRKVGPVPGCAACSRKGPICQQCIACSLQTTTVWSILEREEETDQTEACALQEDSEVPGRCRKRSSNSKQEGLPPRESSPKERANNPSADTQRERPVKVSTSLRVQVSYQEEALALNDLTRQEEEATGGQGRSKDTSLSKTFEIEKTPTNTPGKGTPKSRRGRKRAKLYDDETTEEEEVDE